MRGVGALLSAALTPCVHRSDVPCAGCEMSRRQKIFSESSKALGESAGVSLEDHRAPGAAGWPTSGRTG